MSLYGRVFALIYDPFLALGERAGMQEMRRHVLADAHGRVLEIGAGTGLNLPLYPAAVTSLTLADPEPPMIARLRKRAPQDADRPVDIVSAPAEHLPFADDSFDTVVSTLVLCTVDDPAASLREVARVLAPGGRLLFVEHVRAAEARVARWQDRLHEPWRRFACGCHCNRDIVSALRENHFELADVQQRHWRGMPAIVQPLIIGAAMGPALRPRA
ncbi:type 11 methyltransferase [Mycobacterium antarcticum]|uniref:class I SAM-dependent methyltransferase n=1 Tax=unclassified Mycolicibacterium TaxID=2636767 RepID=UPI00238AFEFD|nr:MULTISPECIES: class I SAM-dependent methyltransferase [unclassified Mycolicibacterium]BDX32215.1 type 11 methyltransferase [Mycolicibacterium sp. TUM20985]GLP75511.1 type 11 methyltransferase [Mycolicibacterium sp. TUM20983]GLP84228.1 type 11 methyltransferase [Mycolicibacterium sp. TUM20984]